MSRFHVALPCCTSSFQRYNRLLHSYKLGNARLWQNLLVSGEPSQNSMPDSSCYLRSYSKSQSAIPLYAVRFPEWIKNLKYLQTELSMTFASIRVCISLAKHRRCQIEKRIIQRFPLKYPLFYYDDRVTIYLFSISLIVNTFNSASGRIIHFLKGFIPF
jgi:hypothetical protein